MSKQKVDKKIELKLNDRVIRVGKDIPASSRGSSNKELRKQLKKIVGKEIFSLNPSKREICE